MSAKWMKLTLLPALAVSLFLANCGDAGQPGGPLLGPEAASPSRAAVLLLEQQGSDAGAVSATIGPEGGALVLGQHALEVPAGAVSAPTRFTMTKVAHEPRFELTAGRLDRNDVGARGFHLPLRLSVSLLNLDLGDPRTLLVFWRKPDGTLVPQPTTLDLEGMRIYGSLSHFSTYVVAQPN